MSHTQAYFAAVARTVSELDLASVDRLASELVALRGRNGRLFLLGVGGSAGNCSHAVNDFRKLCGIEAYAPVDNVSELTARTNDEGWSTVFSAWLKVSRLNAKDAILILSVGGGSEERNVSTNLVEAIKLAKSCGAKTFAIIGRPDGYAAQKGDAVVVVPKTEEHLITPISEAFQGVVWHCLVSHPDLQMNATKW
ncbi:SIS domain-containing protein [Methylobacterium sp. NEAU 140]|uniref:SIS domain-containing protein n=1 Tax=Methylobacterium sp. NEAU 140 TaxID=3064945 RepID=UPI00273336BB|nr:SIS domain-containing protein [Methylobacterium sp. NEAU 140]MDP4025861.1 SIS domain-containing protein [Methylobacterium sp. NEAU 140]